MHRLSSILSLHDIFSEYVKTPIGLLLKYHNLGGPLNNHSKAQLLIGMCMDNRNHLRIPDSFSFIIRSGGADMRYSEFKISYAISVGGIQHIALIGHNNCGMVNLISRKDQFIKGLVEKAGWSKLAAEKHFTQSVPIFVTKRVDLSLVTSNIMPPSQVDCP